MSDAAINFRSTSGYVTDGAGETYSLGEAYPTTRGGFTFGWDIDITGNGRDRANTNDRRLAGIIFQSNSGTQRTFKLDLAAGQYDVRLALGDAGGTQNYEYAQAKDGGTVLFTVDDTDGTATNHFDDAGGTDLTNATWPGSNAAVRVTLAGTQLSLKIGSPAAQANSSTLAHLFASAVGGGGGATTGGNLLLLGVG